MGKLRSTAIIPTFFTFSPSHSPITTPPKLTEGTNSPFDLEELPYHGDSQAAGNGGEPPEAENRSQLTASKKAENLVLQWRENEFCQ